MSETDTEGVGLSETDTEDGSEGSDDTMTQRLRKEWLLRKVCRGTRAAKGQGFWTWVSHIEEVAGSSGPEEVLDSEDEAVRDTILLDMWAMVSKGRGREGQELRQCWMRRKTRRWKGKVFSERLEAELFGKEA